MQLVPSLTLAQAWTLPWHEGTALIRAANARAAERDAGDGADDAACADDPRAKIHTPKMLKFLRRMEGRA